MIKNPTAPPLPMAYISPFVICEYEIYSRCSLCCWKANYKIIRNKKKTTL